MHLTIEQNKYKKILMRLDMMGSSVSPSNIKAVYEFLLYHGNIVPVNDVLRLFKGMKSNLFERINMLHMKAKCLEQRVKEEVMEIGEDNRLIEVEYNYNQQEFIIRPNHNNMKIVWDAYCCV